MALAYTNVERIYVSTWGKYNGPLPGVKGHPKPHGYMACLHADIPGEHVYRCYGSTKLGAVYNLLHSRCFDYVSPFSNLHPQFQFSLAPVVDIVEIEEQH